MQVQQPMQVHQLLFSPNPAFGSTTAGAAAAAAARVGVDAHGMYEPWQSTEADRSLLQL